MTLHRFSLLLGLLGLSSALCCGFSSCIKNTEAHEVAEKMPVSVTRLVTEEVLREIACFGTITFAKKIDLSAAVEGTVFELPVREGQVVRPGQRLISLKNVQLEIRRQQALNSIDSAKASKELAQAKLWEGALGIDARLLSLSKAELNLIQKKADLSEAQRVYANKEELFNAGGVTSETLIGLKLRVDEAQGAVTQAQKDLESAQIGLRDDDLRKGGLSIGANEQEHRNNLITLNTRTLAADVAVSDARIASARRDLEAAEALLDALIITSPIAGTIAAKYVEKGEYVAQNGKLLTIIDTKNVYANLSVSENEMPRIREGMPVLLSLDALQATDIPATVESVSPTADPQTGAFQIKVNLANTKGNYRPGMFVRARITYADPAKLVVIPEKCIIQKKAEDAQVFAVVNGRAFQKTVRLAKDLGGRFAVEQGVSEGDVLIVSPPPTITEGGAVDAH